MSRWLRVLLSQLHNDAVIDKLAQTKAIKESARIAHSLVQATKEQVNQLTAGQLIRAHPYAALLPTHHCPFPRSSTAALPRLRMTSCGRVPRSQHVEQ